MMYLYITLIATVELKISLYMFQFLVSERKYKFYLKKKNI